MEKIYKSIPVQVGVAAELNGEFWGVQYKEGEGTRYDFGPIENAMVADPKLCKCAKDMMSWGGSCHEDQLKKATLRTVTKTCVYEIE